MRVYSPTGKSYIHIAEIPRNEIDKLEFALCKEPKETLAAFYNRQTHKPDVLTNAGFFALSTGETIFNCICDGQVISYNPSYQWGIGVIGDNDIQYGSMASKQWNCFLSGYPNLIDSGKKITIDFAKELNYRARRTMIGFNDKYVYLVCVEGSGMNFKEMQDLMYDLKCDFASNLDGGGSTAMWYEGKRITSAMYNRAVDTVVAVYLKDNININMPSEVEDKRIFRVQLGAFSVSNRIGADAFLKEIKALGGTYSAAYIRTVAGMLKIQVGAFSEKPRAENVVKDLKAKGYDAFITEE